MNPLHAAGLSSPAQDAIDLSRRPSATGREVKFGDSGLKASTGGNIPSPAPVPLIMPPTFALSGKGRYQSIPIPAPPECCTLGQRLFIIETYQGWHIKKCLESSSLLGSTAQKAVDLQALPFSVGAANTAADKFSEKFNLFMTVSKVKTIVERFFKTGSLWSEEEQRQQLEERRASLTETAEHHDAADRINEIDAADTGLELPNENGPVDLTLPKHRLDRVLVAKPPRRLSPKEYFKSKREKEMESEAATDKETETEEEFDDDYDPQEEKGQKRDVYAFPPADDSDDANDRDYKSSSRSGNDSGYRPPSYGSGKKKYAKKVANGNGVKNRVGRPPKAAAAQMRSSKRACIGRAYI